MFYGKQVDLLSHTDADQSTKTRESISSFSNLILQVSPELNDIYSSLDNYTSTETVEFKTDEGFKTSGIKSCWIKEAPPVLSFQLNVCCLNAHLQW